MGGRLKNNFKKANEQHQKDLGVISVIISIIIELGLVYIYTIFKIFS